MSTKTQKRISKGHQNLSSKDTLLLWVAAGGRCEICRKLLTESQISFHELNLAERAHIIGQGDKNSPRHDSVLSPLLASDRDNIMLLCFNCHHEVDALETRSTWPIETLRNIKKLHEERIKYLTSLDAKRTRVLVFQTAIQQSRSGEVPTWQQTILRKDDLHYAILPEYFPDRSEPSYISLDLPTEETPAHWEQMKEIIKTKLDKHDLDGVEHLSVFCLAKMPAIMHLGRLIGNTRKATAMLVQQGVPTGWKSHEQGSFSYQVTRPEKSESGKKDVVLIISLSGVVESQQYSSVTPSEPAIYKIANQTGNLHPNWLIAEEQVMEFQKIYLQVLSEIQERHGQDSIIHLIVAAPTPIVFEIGRQYRPNHQPVLKVYNCIGKRYQFAFSLGE